MTFYINSSDRFASDVILHPPATIENNKPGINPRPDSINKTESDNIPDTQLIAKQSPATVAQTEIIAPTTTVPADETTAPGLENDDAHTAEVIDDRALIADAMYRWSKAWSSQRIEEYLLFYHDDFQPPQNMKKQSWIKDRWVKISRPAWIKVSITEIKIDLLGEDRARVIFQQQYESPIYRDAALKTIHLLKTGRYWKIIREVSVKI